MIGCYKCGYILPPHTKIYRTTRCPECDADLKVCLNCRFYDPSSHWECKETIQEQVKDKDRANFCDYFSPLENPGPRNENQQKKEEDRKKFNNLFGD
jgi:hypothetical protein